MENIDQKIYDLVKEEFGKMKMSKKYSNRAILSSHCQEIIYNDWGFSNQPTWDLIDEYVEELIPEEMD
jgi:hypothetical protein